MKHTLLTLIFTLFLPLSLLAQDRVIKLWDNPITRKEKRPEARLFLPPDSLRNGVCVIVCPGGSYHHLALISEGAEVAQELNKWGITAIVLRYRVGMKGNHHPAMIEDLQRTIQLMRDNAEQYHIDKEKIGCMGYSAGGHLVTLAGITSENYLAKKIKQKTCDIRPNFVCAIYPVVSMQDSIAHTKSRKNLLTKRFTEAQKQQFSLELQVPADMPPLFLLNCVDDPVVDYRNSVVLDKALAEKNCNHQYIQFQKGGHGFGMTRTKSEESRNWNQILKKWMQENNILPTH